MSTAIPNSINLSGPPATIDDLYRVEGKAELIGGRIVRYMPTGDLPGEVAAEILVQLREYAKRTGVGIARGDNVAYTLPRPLKNGRQSFSPDASYHAGPRPANRMRFIDGAPTFAVEVRSEGDYTPAALREMAAKRADYFEAGTLAVWDVDPLGRSITLYRADAPANPTTFGSGQMASAEPAVPGWTVAVDEVIPASA
jgi:Uma2 family endonuclease